jgi:holo-[acyl-carrier protein] synthase
MIHGLGTDIVEIARIENKLISNPSLLNHIYSTEEQAYCNAQRKPYQSYAARFAVKEAFLKAFGVSFIGNHALPEISVSNDKHGKPTISLSGKTLVAFNELGMKSMHVSISHADHYAVASVIIER